VNLRLEAHTGLVLVSVFKSIRAKRFVAL